MKKTGIDKLREYLIARRDDLRLTQEELAKRSGVPRGTIAALEVGQVTKSPRGDTLEKLAKGLEVDVDTLLRIARGEEPKQVASVAHEPGEMRQVIDGLRKRHEPTEEEWAIIDELDRTGSWYGGFSQPGFWELPPEERESEFFYLKGLMREHRKREQSK
jgi:transcriptional regulator with XRE-family HTH domain